jgi:hypothetical protein
MFNLKLATVRRNGDELLATRDETTYFPAISPCAMEHATRDFVPKSLQGLPKHLRISWTNRPRTEAVICHET